MAVGRQVVLFVKTQKKKQSSFTTRHGLLLTLVIGTFFALVFLLVYYIQVKTGRSL